MDSVGYLKDLAIILLAAKVFGICARKLHAPEVVGEILAGLIIGPAVLGIVSQSDFISQMAEIGVVMLMFEAGLGTDMKKLKETGLQATAVACAGVFVPIILGTVLFMSFYGWGTPGSEQFLKGLFIGTIMAATSVSITVAALKELGRLSGTVGTTIVSAAIIDDVIGIVVLTFVLSAKGTDTSVWIIVFKAIAFFAIAIVSGFLVNKIFVWLDSRYEHTRRIPIAALVYCLAMAYVAEKFFGIVKNIACRRGHAQNPIRSCKRISAYLNLVVTIEFRERYLGVHTFSVQQRKSRGEIMRYHRTVQCRQALIFPLQLQFDCALAHMSHSPYRFCYCTAGLRKIRM